MDEQEKQYQKGFNHGYILAGHDMDLANSMLATLRSNHSEYAIGLSNGHDMYILDNNLTKKEWDKSHKELEAIDSPDKKYIKGFNIGYFLAEHEPKLAKLIVKQPNESRYFRGIVAGKQEYEIEKMKNRLKTVTKNPVPAKGKNINKGRSK